MNRHYWQQPFSRRDPISPRFARSLAEAEDDPLAWWEGPGPERPPTRGWLDALCWAVGLLLIALALTAPHWWPRLP